jgi:hypothetical protein
MAKLGESAIIGILLAVIVYLFTSNLYFAASVGIIFFIASMLNLGFFIVIIIALLGGVVAAQYFGSPFITLPGLPTGGTLPSLPTGVTLPNWTTTTGTTLVAQSTLSSVSSSGSTTSSVSSDDTCGRQCCTNDQCSIYNGVNYYICIANMCDIKSCQQNPDCPSGYMCSHLICTRI